MNLGDELLAVAAERELARLRRKLFRRRLRPGTKAQNPDRHDEKRRAPLSFKEPCRRP